MGNVLKARGVIDFNKEMFLQNFENDLTREYYERLFKTDLFDFENRIGKNVLDFGLDDIYMFVRSLKTTSKNAEVVGRILSSYFNYSIEHGIIDRKNPLEDITSKELKSLGKEIKYFSKEDIDDTISNIVNPQDSVIIRLLFEGFNGKEFSDITNITIYDIDTKAKKISGHKVSDDLIELIDEAFRQSKYVKKNGEEAFIERVDFELDMVMNKYIIRNTLTNTDEVEKPVDKSVVFRRIKMISNVLQIDNFNATNIFKSGQIWYAYMLMNQSNKKNIDKDIYNQVMKRYKITNYYALREYLNDDIINDLYNKKGEN